jgi:hypothetical protein
VQLGQSQPIQTVDAKHRAPDHLTYSMRTRLPGRLLPQAVLTLGEIAAQSVGTVGRGKLLQILLRTHSVPTADRHLGQQTRSAGLRAGDRSGNARVAGSSNGHRCSGPARRLRT